MKETNNASAQAAAADIMMRHFYTEHITIEAALNKMFPDATCGFRHADFVFENGHWYYYSVSPGLPSAAHPRHGDTYRTVNEGDYEHYMFNAFRHRWVKLPANVNLEN